MIFFLSSLEMSAPILSGWKRRRMREREGRSEEDFRGRGRRGSERGDAAEIHAAL